MEPVRVLKSQVEVDDRLAELGLSRQSLIRVIEQVVAARANVISADAATAGGTQAYLAGIRHLRLSHVEFGFAGRRSNGVEFAFHPKTGVSLFYQSVDIACSEYRSPKAVHKKGPASSRILEDSTFLFSPDQIPETLQQPRLVNKQSYVLCVCVGEGEVTAELSNPTRIEDGNFEAFAERLFIVSHGEWSVPDLTRYEAPPDDYDFSITKK